MQQFLLLYSSPNGLENGRSLRDNLEQQNEDGDRFFFFFFDNCSNKDRNRQFYFIYSTN